MLRKCQQHISKHVKIVRTARFLQRVQLVPDRPQGVGPGGYGEGGGEHLHGDGGAAVGALVGKIKVY